MKLNSFQKRSLIKRAAWYRAGRLDRAAGMACRSPNGVYLDGWYSDELDGHYPGLPKATLEDTEAMNAIHEKAKTIRMKLDGDNR